MADLTGRGGRADKRSDGVGADVEELRSSIEVMLLTRMGRVELVGSGIGLSSSTMVNESRLNVGAAKMISG